MIFLIVHVVQLVMLFYREMEMDYCVGLAMRLRIHAVHADHPHMRCACKNLDAHQPHTGAKYTAFPHLIPPSIYGVMYVLELDLAVESASHQYE